MPIYVLYTYMLTSIDDGGLSFKIKLSSHDIASKFKTWVFN